MEHFIDTSNAQYTCSERDWTGGDYPRWAWNECKDWLVANGFVIDKSANGNRSFRWYPGKYAEILAAKTNEYYKAHPVPNLNDSEKVYFTEEELEA